MNEILKNALIPEEQWEFCHIIDDAIYTPLFDEDGHMLKTGKQVCEDLMNSRDLPTTPSIEERLALLEALELGRILGEE